jgi:lactate dehydrogenase-like 2-hydroxyacid dehydrogenase
VIANTGLYAADVIILSDQSCLSIGNAPKRLQITYNVHIVCIVTQLNEIDLKSARHHVISVYTCKSSLTMSVIVTSVIVFSMPMEVMLIADSPI